MEIVREAIELKKPVKALVNHRAGGNAPLIYSRDYSQILAKAEA